MKFSLGTRLLSTWIILQVSIVAAVLGFYFIAHQALSGHELTPKQVRSIGEAVTKEKDVDLLVEEKQGEDGILNASYSLAGGWLSTAVLNALITVCYFRLCGNKRPSPFPS